MTSDLPPGSKDEAYEVLGVYHPESKATSPRVGPAPTPQQFHPQLGRLIWNSGSRVTLDIYEKGFVYSQAFAGKSGQPLRVTAPYDDVVAIWVFRWRQLYNFVIDRRVEEYTIQIGETRIVLNLDIPRVTEAAEHIMHEVGTRLEVKYLLDMGRGKSVDFSPFSMSLENIGFQEKKWLPWSQVHSVAIEDGEVKVKEPRGKGSRTWARAKVKEVPNVAVLWTLARLLIFGARNRAHPR